MAVVTAAILATVLCGALLPHAANGHAMLAYPTAWNPNPSKTMPCGGLTTYPAANQVVNMSINTDVAMSWQVIAGDGVGTVTALISTTGSVNSFTTPWPGFSVSAPQVGTFPFSVTVPNITCNPTCTAQVSSTSGWVSCFSFTTGDYGVLPPSVVPKVCVNANGLGYCTMLNGRQVLSPAGESLVQRDAQLAVYSRALVNNSAVFTTALGNDVCINRLSYVLCQGAYNYCGASSLFKLPDRCYCETTMTMCGLTDLHRSLFNCSAFPDCPAQQTSAAPATDGWSVQGAVQLAGWTYVAVQLLSVLLV